MWRGCSPSSAQTQELTGSCACGNDGESCGLDRTVTLLYNPPMRIIMCVLLPLLISSVDSETVVESVFRRQDALDEQYSSARFRSMMRYIESDLKSGNVKCVDSERLVTIPKVGDQTHEYGSVWINGQPVDGEERKKEIETLMSRGKHAERTLMPFFPETRDEYEYTVARRDTWQGMPVWRVEFVPKRETGQHITGRALVLDGTYDIVSLEFTPSDLPFMVMDATMELDYGLVEGRWLPVRFEMDMDLRLALVVELMRRHVRVEETYSDYTFTLAAPEGTENGE